MALESLNFVCPYCRGTLASVADALVCDGCGKSFGVENSLYKFITSQLSHGELSQQQMRGVTAYAEQYGWRRAVEEKMPSYREIAARLAQDSGRDVIFSPLEENGGRVLDFGCGYGATSRALARKFDHVIAVDGSEDRIRLLNIACRQDHIENVTTVCHSDVERLPFADASFDAVVLVGVFEYLPQATPDFRVEEAHRRSLRSFWRILKPGGQLLLATKNRFGWNYLRGAPDHSGIRFAPALPRWTVDIMSRCSGRGLYRIVNYSKSGYMRLVYSTGFDQARFYWPIPGYQFAEYLIDLEEDVAAQVAALPQSMFLPGRRAAITWAARIGLLSKIVPHFIVLATKLI